MSRFVFLVLDGVGVGALPDAGDYGDAGSNTLGNLGRVVDLRLPFLERSGLGSIVPILGVPPASDPVALPGRLATRSVGKDTTVGHWEHMGLITARAFPTYPEGFPEEVLVPFSERTGRHVLGNKPASGTAIIEELGEAHLATGDPIVYTSADSVLQIAAHTGVVPLEQLYEWCRIARDIMQGRHAVARVIARPFTGAPGAFVRTKDRRDFSLAPPGATYLDLLKEAGVPVIALGKVSQIFTGRGVAEEIKVSSNEDNLELVIELLERRSARGTFDSGLLFTNLVDFDMVWGHRNDADGFAAGLSTVDAALPRIVAALDPGDMLLLTADHGVDPTTVSTDHSREYVPLLLYPRPPGIIAGVYQGTLADTGATAYASLSGKAPPIEGDVITRFRPSRGWRHSPVALPCPRSPGRLVSGRVGAAEAAEAATYLSSLLGPPPAAAIVLGSGLSDALEMTRTIEVPYHDIPFWREGAVAGHPYRLALGEYKGQPVALLEGRIHAYEGFDLSELELPIQTLAGWGVRRVLLTSACGAVGPGRPAGHIVLDREVLDLQTEGLCQAALGRLHAPDRLPATPGVLAAEILSEAEGGTAAWAGAALWLSAGVHASVPGPHYETEAELEYLRVLGASSVSMSAAPELRAARRYDLEAAVLSVIVNAGHTTHGGVLAGAADAGGRFTAVVRAVLNSWGY